MRDAYLKSGVNVDAGYNLLENIKAKVKSTSIKGTSANIGGFGGLFDLSLTEFGGPILVGATDGVGTKLKIASHCNIHDYIGIDLVAMCVNDILAQGATPLFFLDYYATGKLEVKQASKIIHSIADGCLAAQCALIGGETAEMPGHYQGNDYDLAGFCVGATTKSQLRPTNIYQGDQLIAIASSGLHANGFSLVRKIIKEHNIDLNSQAPFDNKQTIGQALLTPTKIYVNAIKPLLNNDAFLAMAHITGGGFSENIPRILPHNLKAYYDDKFELPPIFSWLATIGKIDHQQMQNIFNCGIGAVIATKAGETQNIINQIIDNGFKAWHFGEVKEK